MFTINKCARVALVVACAALVAGVLGHARRAKTNERVQVVASSISDDATTSSMSGYMVAVG